MWRAEITNDPMQEYRLYIELLEDDAYRGRVELDESGSPILTIYPAEARISIPGNWLEQILRGAQKDLMDR